MKNRFCRTLNLLCLTLALCFTVTGCGLNSRTQAPKTSGAGQTTQIIEEDPPAAGRSPALPGSTDTAKPARTATPETAAKTNDKTAAKADDKTDAKANDQQTGAARSSQSQTGSQIQVQQPAAQGSDAGQTGSQSQTEQPAVQGGNASQTEEPAAQVSNAGQNQGSGQTQPQTPNAQDAIAAIHAGINAERAKVDQSALTYRDDLQAMADERACQILTDFSHSQWRPVLEAYGIRCSASAENISMVPLSMGDAAHVPNWVSSAGHYANLTNGSYAYTVIGVAYEGGNSYAVQLFFSDDLALPDAPETTPAPEATPEPEDKTEDKTETEATPAPEEQVKPENKTETKPEDKTEDQESKKDPEPSAPQYTFTEVVHAPTCTEQGYTEHVCNEDASRTYTDSYVPAAGHSWDDGKVTKAAACTEAGEKTFTCAACGLTRTEELPATGHYYSAWSVTREPEVGVEGEESCTCYNCGNVLTKTTPAKPVPEPTPDPTPEPETGNDDVCPRYSDGEHFYSATTHKCRCGKMEPGYEDFVYYEHFTEPIQRSIIQEIHVGTNEVREQCGRSSLPYAEYLQPLANERAQQLLTHYAHGYGDPSRLGCYLDDLMDKYGYDFERCSENIGRASYIFSKGRNFATGWSESPGHFNTQISREWTATVVGVSYDPEYDMIYAVQIFVGKDPDLTKVNQEGTDGEPVAQAAAEEATAEKAAAEKAAAEKAAAEKAAAEKAAAEEAARQATEQAAAEEAARQAAEQAAAEEAARQAAEQAAAGENGDDRLTFEEWASRDSTEPSWWSSDGSWGEGTEGHATTDENGHAELWVSSGDLSGSNGSDDSAGDTVVSDENGNFDLWL